MPSQSISSPLRGVFPILATCFQADGAIDLESERSLIEFCVDGGVHGLVMLANASEGHLLSEAEKRELLAFGIEQIAGRVPVIATVNHPSSRVTVELALEAEGLGAAAVMAMPPFFGRWRAGPDEILRHFRALDRAVGIPIVLQDHALSDISLPVGFIATMAAELPRLRYLKLESGNIIHKTRALVEAASRDVDGVFGGNSGIFLPEEMEAGCAGTMPACYMPEVFRRTWDLVEAGRTEEAKRYFTPFSRIAAYEKDVANRCVWKAILVHRGVIACDAVREPAPAFANDFVKGQLLEIATRASLLD